MATPPDPPPGPRPRVTANKLASRGRPPTLQVVEGTATTAFGGRELVAFTVPGRPLPAGSKDRVPIIQNGVVVGHRIVESGNRAAKAAWRADIQHRALEAMDGRPLLEGPIILAVRFDLRRPKAHYRTGRHAGTIKPNAPEHPTTMPDLLKLARALEDAMTGAVYRDDSQIVSEHLHKRYVAGHGGCRVTVVRVEPGGAT